MRTQWLVLGLVLAFGFGCGGSPSSNGDGDDGSGNGGGSGGGGDGDEVDAGSGGGGGGGGGEDVDAGPTEDVPFAECAGEEEEPPPDNSLCLIEEDPDDPDNPGTFGVIEQSYVTYDGVEAVHVRVTLDPDFVDNTYGDNICGWTDTGHSFGDLEESDALEFVMLNSEGDVVFDLFVDYISEDPDSECGYSSLGVDGGDGFVETGDRDAILGTQTSLSKNFNERGYCYPEDSPEAGDDCCTPPEDAAEWDYRVVYDVWVRRDAFDPAFGSAYMDYVHASPSKLGPSQHSVDVDPVDCNDDGDDDGGGDDGGGDDGGGDDGGGDDGGGDDGGGDDQCTDDSDCADDEFCYEGDCVTIVVE